MSETVTLRSDRAAAHSSLDVRSASDYSVVLSRVRNAGLLKRSARAAVPRTMVITGMLAVGIAAAIESRHSWWVLAAGAFLGVVFGQLGFLGHEAGHQQVFTSKRWNDHLGRWISGLGVGLSYGWWVDKHNRHHRNPNSVEHDPDVQRNILAWTDDQAAAQSGLFAIIARHQGVYFFPLIVLEAMNLHVSSARASFRRSDHRTLEMSLLVGHVICWIAFSFVLMSPWHALAFLGVQQAVFGVYLGCSFAPNHKGMPILDPCQQHDYFRRQVLTSRNVSGGRVMSAVFGGLNYQIEHHLFPSMPRHNLPRCREIVRPFCQERGVAYCEVSLVVSYRHVLSYLNGVKPPLTAAASADGLSLEV